MSTTVKKTPVRPVVNVKKLPDGTFMPMLDNTLKGLTANAAAYPKPPVDLTTYGNAISAYVASVSAALDGGKSAVAQKNKLRVAVTKLYDQLAKYVETNSNDDMQTFLLSGFQAKTTAKTKNPPATDSIRKIEHGANSGQLVVTLVKTTGAKAYELRYAPVPPGGSPGTWTTLSITVVKTPTTISGLTPATTYAFQARALTKTGFTDFGAPITVICT